MDANGRYIAFALGLVLVAYAMFTAPASQHFVNALEDWNYMRPLSLSVPSQYVGVPVVLKLPLPSDANFWSNTDCNDVRFTVGAGASERIIPSQLVDCNVQQRTGYALLFVTPSSTTNHFRIYYGNNHVLAPSPVVSDFSTLYRASLRSSDVTYSLAEGTADWGFMRFACCRFYLMRWGIGGAEATVTSVPVRDYALTSFALRFNGWGHGYVFIPLSDPSSNVPPTTSLSALQSAFPSYILFSVTDHGNAKATVVSNGETLATATAPRYRDYPVYITRTPSGVYVALGSFNSHRAYVSLSSPLTRLRFYVIGYRDGTVVALSHVKSRYLVVPVSVHYGVQVLAPKMPVISVSSPSDGAYLDTNHVLLSLSVYDPNGDLNTVVVTLDGNVMLDVNRSNPSVASALPSTPFTYSTTLDLNDGSHTLTVRAADLESASAVSTLSFVVDTVPPELNISDVNVTDANVSFHVSASDPNLDGCYYYVNDDQNTHAMTCDGNVVIPVHAGDHVVVWAQDKAGNLTIKRISVPAHENKEGKACPCVIVVFSGHPPASSPATFKPTPSTVSHIVSSHVQPASPTSVSSSASAGVLIVLVLIVLGAVVGL